MSVDISTDISTEISAECQLTYRLTIGWYIGRYLGRYMGRVSVDMLTDISVECWSTYRPINRLSVVSVECRSICLLIYRSRGAQNTQDPFRYIYCSLHLSTPFWISRTRLRISRRRTFSNSGLKVRACTTYDTLSFNLFFVHFFVYRYCILLLSGFQIILRVNRNILPW